MAKSALMGFGTSLSVATLNGMLAVKPGSRAERVQRAVKERWPLEALIAEAERQIKEEKAAREANE